MTAITLTGDNIRKFQLLAQIKAVELESRGMTHSRGNITPKLRRLYKLGRYAPYQQVIDRLRQEMENEPS